MTLILSNDEVEETQRLLPRFLFCIGVLFFLFPGIASAQAHFYQGKTITIIQGRSAGGTGDMYVRSVMPFLQKYIPGNPSIVPEYMPGGGGRKLANHIYGSARPDGLTIGAGPGGIIASGVLGEVGTKYDLQRFIYLGSTYSVAHPLFLTRKAAGFSSLEKLRAATGIRIGGESVGFTTYNEARIFAYVLGLKEPRFVVGYSGQEADLAFIQGEVDTRTTLIATLLTRNRDWIEKDLVDFHAVIEVPKGEKHPQFPHLLDLETFAKSDRERKLIGMQRAFRLVGAPFFLPPGTPADRVGILREAMRKTFRDPEFHAQHKKLVGAEPTPLSGEAQEKALRELLREGEVVELMKKMVGPEPLPAR
ncbi:MAG: hypothetical protein HY695_14590 [Deltaproteobacteria bacterium]|nr:hypothetical protein [Deltaproteobacteria bacterium]